MSRIVKVFKSTELRSTHRQDVKKPHFTLIQGISNGFPVPTNIWQYDLHIALTTAFASVTVFVHFGRNIYIIQTNHTHNPSTILVYYYPPTHKLSNCTPQFPKLVLGNTLIILHSGFYIVCVPFYFLSCIHPFLD